jgi:hypothetical protein
MLRCRVRVDGIGGVAVRFLLLALLGTGSRAGAAY